MNSTVAATTHHEAGHAVVSFVLGVKFMFILMNGQNEGAVVQQCARCESCIAYFEKNDPENDFHSERIRDDIRREIAVAVAGEIAEVLFTKAPEKIDPADVAKDRSCAREWACFLHIWYGKPQCAWTDACSISDPFLAAMRSHIEELLSAPATWGAVTMLATHLGTSDSFTSWNEAVAVIEEGGGRFGTVSVDSLPLPVRPATT